MIKESIIVFRKAISTGAYDGKLLSLLFITSILRNLAILLLPLMAARIIEYATNGEYEMGLRACFMFLGAALLYVLFHHLNFVAYKKNQVIVHNKLQQMIMDKVTTYDENFTKDISVAHIISTSFNDVGKIVSIYDYGFDAISSFISIVIGFVILFGVDIYIGIVAIVIGVVSLLSLNKSLKNKNYYQDKQREEQDNIAGLMGQVIDGNKEINAFNMNNDVNAYLDGFYQKWKKDYFKKRKYFNRMDVFVPAIIGFGKIALYCILAKLVLDGQYDIAVLVLVIGYYENIESRAEELIEELEGMTDQYTRLNRIHKILSYKTKNMQKFGTDKTDDINGKIEFKKVSFTYEKQQTLNDVSFKIQPNTFTAIIGKSGSGKSTIFRLLLRLYKANKGEIYLDDKNIYEYDKEVYPSNVSIVTQKPFIFDMSIRENLALVDSNVEHQIAACKRAGVHDFIMSLKDGYNTKLIADAENISIGEKQLIALARTLLSKSEVLLFDEVTSPLDMKTSEKIMGILKDLKKDHTVLMITHKPSLMKLADDIIVIDHGKLVGRGTHQELIKNNKYYQLLQK